VNQRTSRLRPEDRDSVYTPGLYRYVGRKYRLWRIVDTESDRVLKTVKTKQAASSALKSLNENSEAI
jgi:hypothetical protein